MTEPRPLRIRAMPMPTKVPQGWDLVHDGSEKKGWAEWHLKDEQGLDVANILISKHDLENDSWFVDSVGGGGGWGAFMYETALNFVSSFGHTLMRDSSVSDSAAKVWQKYKERADRGTSVVAIPHDKRPPIRNYIEPLDPSLPPAPQPLSFKERRQEDALRYKYQKKQSSLVLTAMPMMQRLPPGHIMERTPSDDADIRYRVAWRVYGPQSRTYAHSYIALARDKHDDDWYVSSVYSDMPGLGPLLYETALDFVSSRGEFLRSDTSVSDQAARVWRKYHERAQRGTSIITRPRLEHTLPVRRNDMGQPLEGPFNLESPESREEEAFYHSYQKKQSGLADWLKSLVAPESEPGESAYLPEELLHGPEFGGAPKFQLGKPVVVYGTDQDEYVKGFGSRAVAKGKSADPTRFPLPQSGVGSVFFRNGREGIMRGWGKEYALVEFSEGLYHMKVNDLRDPVGYDFRRRPAQVLSVFGEEGVMAKEAGLLKIPPRVLDEANKQLKVFQASVRRYDAERAIKNIEEGITKRNEKYESARLFEDLITGDVELGGLLESLAFFGSYSYPEAVATKRVLSTESRVQGESFEDSRLTYPCTVTTTDTYKDGNTGKPATSSRNRLCATEAELCRFIASDVHDFVDIYMGPRSTDAEDLKRAQEALKAADAELQGLGSEPVTRWFPSAGERQDKVTGNMVPNVGASYVYIPVSYEDWAYTGLAQDIDSFELPKHLSIGFSTGTDKDGNNGTYGRPSQDAETGDDRGSGGYVDVYNAMRPDAERSLAHEIRHHAQYVLTRLRGKNGLGYAGYGQPGREFTNKKREYQPGKVTTKREFEWHNLPHAARDEEFHTRLGDEVYRFLEREAPMAKRRLMWEDAYRQTVKYLEKATTPDDREEYQESARNALDSIKRIDDVRSRIREWIGSSEFFTELKRHKVHNWYKAVREFTKAVTGGGEKQASLESVFGEPGVLQQQRPLRMTAASSDYRDQALLNELRQFYEAEYKWSALTQARADGPLPDRAERERLRWQEYLERQLKVPADLNADQASMGHALLMTSRRWMRDHAYVDWPTGERNHRGFFFTHAREALEEAIKDIAEVIKDGQVDGDLSTWLRATETGPFMISGNTLDLQDLLAKPLKESGVKLTPEMLLWLQSSFDARIEDLRDEARYEYDADEPDRNKNLGITWDSREKTFGLVLRNVAEFLDVAQGTDIKAKIVAFHKMLTAAHNTGGMIEYMANYASARMMVSELHKLSNQDTSPWDAEIKTLLSAPRGASLKLTAGEFFNSTADQMKRLAQFYQAEYMWSALDRARQEGPLPDRAEKERLRYQEQLERYLADALPHALVTTHEWLERRVDMDWPSDYTGHHVKPWWWAAAAMHLAPHILRDRDGMDDTWVDLEKKLNAASNRIRDEATLGIELRAIGVDVTPEQLRQYWQRVEEFARMTKTDERTDWPRDASEWAEREKVWAGVHKAYDQALAARNGSLRSRIAAFHILLNTAHNSGSLAEHIFDVRGSGRQARTDLAIALRELSELDTSAWDAELQKLLSAPRGASIKLTASDLVEVPLDKLVVNRDSLMRAYEDSTHSSGSRAARSIGPVSVWALKNGEYLITDGHHRLVEMLLAQKPKSVAARVIGEGDTGYWHIPTGRERTLLDPGLRYGGLEDIASTDSLRLATRELKQTRATTKGQASIKLTAMPTIYSKAWVDPTGTWHEVRDNEMHRDWALAHGATGADLFRAGWIRVAARDSVTIPTNATSGLVKDVLSLMALRLGRGSLYATWHGEETVYDVEDGEIIRKRKCCASIKLTAHSSRDIAVCIPKAKLNLVEREEADVATRMKVGETGLGYFWQMGRLPKTQPRRIYFVWNGAVRAYHNVTGMDDQRVLMSPTINDIEPIAMPGFRGFRYFDEAEARTRSKNTP